MKIPKFAALTVLFISALPGSLLAANDDEDSWMQNAKMLKGNFSLPDATRSVGSLGTTGSMDGLTALIGSNALASGAVDHAAPGGSVEDKGGSGTTGAFMGAATASRITDASHSIASGAVEKK